MMYAIPVLEKALYLATEHKLVEFCNYIQVVLEEYMKMGEMVEDVYDETYL